MTLWYNDEPRLIMGLIALVAVSSSSGGSLKGEPSIGLTGVESAKGFLVETGVAVLSATPAGARYGGGAVVAETDLGIGSGAAAIAGFTLRSGLGLIGCVPEIASLYGGATSSMLCKLGSALCAPARELFPPLRTLGSLLRMLLELEERPPISNSASKEKTLKCRDHFFLLFWGAFSDTTVPAAFLLLLLLAHNKNSTTAAMTATTTGTATAAFRAEEHDILSQDVCETVTAPSLVLLAALVPVLVAVPLMLADASVPVAEVTVARVVGAAELELDCESDCEPDCEPDCAEVEDAAEDVDVVLAPGPSVPENSLCKEDIMLFIADVAI